MMWEGVEKEDVEVVEEEEEEEEEEKEDEEVEEERDKRRKSWGGHRKTSGHRVITQWSPRHQWPILSDCPQA